MTDTLSLYAVFGQPIGHSLSPVLHNRAFAARSLSAFYLPVDCSPEALLTKLEAFQQLGGLGVNLTRPLKELVVPYLAGQHAWVQAAGAANTLVWHGEGWYGANTDCEALRALLPRGQAGTALVLGAGGAARASAAVLRDLGYRVVVAARRPEAVRFGDEALLWADRLDVRGARVVVNATPLGQVGEDGDRNWPIPEDGGVAVDWVYRPRLTPFLRVVESRPVTVVDGLSLFVAQARFSWGHWFNYVGPETVMWDAVQTWA